MYRATKTCQDAEVGGPLGSYDGAYSIKSDTCFASIAHVGRAEDFQSSGRGFDSRLTLHIVLIIKKGRCRREGYQDGHTSLSFSFSTCMTFTG